MTREQIIDMAVRRQLLPQWMRHFAEYPDDLPKVTFRDTGMTALMAVRDEFAVICNKAWA